MRASGWDNQVQEFSAQSHRLAVVLSGIDVNTSDGWIRSPLHGVRLGVLAATVALCLSLDAPAQDLPGEPVREQVYSPADSRSLKINVVSNPQFNVRRLALLIAGIVSYTRWPASPNPIWLCVLGHDELLDELKSGDALSSARPITVHGVKLGMDFKASCNAVYVTAMPPENAKQLLFQIVSAPVVSIGEGPEFCSDGGMFCLHADTGVPSQGDRRPFSVNLDVVSRSGLRINPQVLLLAKPPGAMAP
jgi:hypothetical protein